MANTHHTCQMTLDKHEQFASTSFKGLPPLPTKANISFRLETPFSSPADFDFLPSRIETRMKRNLPDNSDSSNQHSEPAPPAQAPSANDLIGQLIRAMTLMGQATTTTNPSAPAPPPSTSTTRIRSPDAFDGSNPNDLRPFLLQCQLIFNSYPQQYTTDSAKVFFHDQLSKEDRLGMVQTQSNGR